MKTLLVYKKSILEQVRDFKSLIIIILTPIIFITIFGLAFGQGYYTYDVSISNDDKGPYGQEIVEMLKDSQYENGNDVFTITTTPNDKEQIYTDLKNRAYAVHIYIPEDFTDKVRNSERKEETKLIMTGDPAYSFFELAKINLDNYITDFVNKKIDVDLPVSIETNEINQAKIKSEFDAMVPGLIIMSMYFLAILSAMVLSREVENKTLARLLLSRLKARELYAGITLSQMTLAIVMIPMAIITTYLLGFSGEGSLTVTFFIACVASLSAIGLGMIIAAFSRNGLDAFVIGNIVVTPMFFLSGVFFPAPGIGLFSIAGMEMGILSFIPSLPAVTAANKVLINSDGLFDIIPELTLLLILTVLYFIIGVILFSRKYARRS